MNDHSQSYFFNNEWTSKYEVTFSLFETNSSKISGKSKMDWFFSIAWRNLSANCFGFDGVATTVYNKRYSLCIIVYISKWYLNGEFGLLGGFLILYVIYKIFKNIKKYDILFSFCSFSFLMLTFIRSAGYFNAGYLISVLILIFSDIRSMKK